MRWVPIQPSSIGTRDKASSHGGEEAQWWYDGGDTAEKGVTENDENRKRSVSCRVVSEASLKQVVPQIVTEVQVTMLNPWRKRLHVF